MPLIIVLVAVAAAVGVALVMYGIVSRERAVAAADTGRSARVTYRTLADVREQLRRRFEPTGTLGPGPNAEELMVARPLIRSPTCT